MGGGEIVRLGLRKTFMRLALVRSPARSATTMLYPMALSMGLSSSPVGWLEFGEELLACGRLGGWLLD